LPIATLRWNNGVHNYMTYITGNIPVGVYDSTRLSNVGIGHSAIDAGGGYTYLNPQTGHEFSGVLGFTYNFTNQSTQYQNGVGMQFDWGGSQFLTKQVQVGVVGYVYRELGCDTRRRSGRLLPVAGGRRRPAGRVYHSAEHHDAGLPQSQELLGVREPEPARRLERVGHIRDLAGGTDAKRPAATNVDEVTEHRCVARGTARGNTAKPFSAVRSAARSRSRWAGSRPPRLPCRAPWQGRRSSSRSCAARPATRTFRTAGARSRTSAASDRSGEEDQHAPLLQ